jgi:hypothetical protein
MKKQIFSKQDSIVKFTDIKSLNNKLLSFFSLEGLYKTNVSELDRFSAFPDFFLSPGVKHAIDTYCIDWFLGIICAYQTIDKIKGHNFQIWDLYNNVDHQEIVCMDDKENIVHKHPFDASHINFYYHHFRVYLFDNKIILPCEL